MASADINLRIPKSQQNLTLAGLSPDVAGELVEVRTAPPLRERLTDLGFIPGCHLKVIRTGPANNLIAVVARGTTVALRSREARFIVIRTGGQSC